MTQYNSVLKLIQHHHIYKWKND